MTSHFPCLAVVGGDSRQLYMAKHLRTLGYRVLLTGFTHASLPAPPQTCTLSEALRGADAAVLPLPVSRDERTLNAVFSDRELPLSVLAEQIRPDTPVFCGMPSDAFSRMLTARRCTVLDYFTREDFTLHNALLTAEGLLGLLCEKLPVTVFGLRCAVTGYGRVARFVCRTLRLLGAQVTVFARSTTARAQAQTDYLRAEPLTALPLYAEHFDCIVNTVPSPVVSEETIAVSDTDCVFIELASAPGGIDTAAVERYGRRLLRGASLPGKTAPKTAGEIIAETIHRMITEGST